MLVSRVPAKLDKGDKLRAFYQIKHLSARYDIYLICLDTESESYNLKNLDQYCKEIKIFRIGRWSKMFQLLKAWVTGVPYQVAYFYNPSIKKKIHQYISFIQPDHIYSQLIRTAEYVKNIHSIPKTLDYMDAFSKGVERRIEHVNFLMRPLFKSEHKRLLKYESLIFEYFDKKTIISDIDREFIFHVNRKQIEIVSNGIDESFFDLPSKWNNQGKVLFTGNMSYPPNVKASEFIENRLAVKAKDLQFVIAGANSEKLNKLAVPNVECTGWVEDIREVYKEARVFIAPMFIGTGVQNKILEAMAMGLPIITTDLGNKPLGAGIESEILVANTEDEFIEQIRRVMKNKELYDKLSSNGREFVRLRFSWQKSVQKLIELMTN
ncbi:MAG: glycosyltransferase [Crocinitomicaceae bacterium]